MSTAHTNGTIHSVRSAARECLDRGWQPVPVEVRGKRPWDFTTGRLRNEWERLTVTDANVNELFTPNANIGVRLGAPSRGLVDVDLDCPEARRAAPILLPHTEMIGGRSSAPDSHGFYVVDEPPAKASDAPKDPISREKLLESALDRRANLGGPERLRAPSPTTRNREPFVWKRHGEPGRVSTDVLQTAVRAVELRPRPWGALLAEVLRDTTCSLLGARRRVAPGRVAGRTRREVRARRLCGRARRGTERPREPPSAPRSPWTRTRSSADGRR